MRKLNSTSGYKKKHILNLALPIIISMLSINILDIVDTAMIGHLGDDALAGTGFASFLFWVSFSIFLGLGAGTQTLTARLLGENKMNQLGKPFLSSLLFITAYSLPIMVVLLFFAPTIFTYFTKDSSVLQIANTYFNWRILGLLAIGYNIMFRGFWNGLKEPKVYTTILIGTHLFNMFLNWVLIFGHFGVPELGVKGAAIGSTLSLYTGVITYFIVTYLKKSTLFNLENLTDKQTYRSLFKIGWPAGLDQLLFSLSLFCFFWIFGQMGTAAAAIAHVVLICSVVLWMPGLGFGMTSLSLVSESIGKADFKEAYDWPWHIIKVGVPYIIGLGFFLFFFADKILSLFIKNPQTLEAAIFPLRLDLLTLWIACVGTILMESLNGSSRTKVVMCSKALFRWGLLLPGAYIIGLNYGYGLNGVWLYWVLITILEMVVFIGLWRRFKGKSQ